MSELPELPKEQQLHFEIDARLGELWDAIMRGLEEGEETVGLDTLGAAIRYAYARGYYDHALDGEDRLGPASGYPQWQPPAREEHIDLT